MSTWHWIAAGTPVLLTGFGWWVYRRHVAKKGLVLHLLAERGELTGMELRDAGVGGLVYSYLYELEKEGFVARRSDGLPHPERGGHPLYFYRLKGTSRGAVA